MAAKKDKAQEPAQVAEIIPDEIGDLLVKEGLVPNIYILDLNRKLQVPYDMAVPAPFDLPSRLFRFPISVSPVAKNCPRRLGLLHPLLVDHPFAQKVEAVIGFKLAVEAPDDEVSSDRHSFGHWWHAVDLMSEGRWQDLLATARFTSTEMIAKSVSFGLALSNKSRNGRPVITTAEARKILAAIGVPEIAPKDTFPQAFLRRMSLKREGGQIDWPINSGFGIDFATSVWGYIVGVERGWFAFNRSGYLSWTEAGRNYYDAGSETAEPDSVGQFSLAL